MCIDSIGMPVSSGWGKWPSEYGVGVKEDRLQNDKCIICTQKGCFRCEHQTPVKRSIFNQEPYLNPQRVTLADKNGTVANFLKTHAEHENSTSQKNESIQPTTPRSVKKNQNNKSINSNSNKSDENKKQTQTNQKKQNTSSKEIEKNSRNSIETKPTMNQPNSNTNQQLKTSNNSNNQIKPNQTQVTGTQNQQTKKNTNEKKEGGCTIL